MIWNKFVYIPPWSICIVLRFTWSCGPWIHAYKWFNKDKYTQQCDIMECMRIFGFVEWNNSDNSNSSGSITTKKTTIIERTFTNGTMCDLFTFCIYKVFWSWYVWCLQHKCQPICANHVELFISRSRSSFLAGPHLKLLPLLFRLFKI